MRRHARFVAAVALLSWSPAIAQAPRQVRRLALSTLDVTVTSHAAFGVHIYAAPSLRTATGQQKVTLFHLRLDPDSLQHWLNLADGFARLQSAPGEPDGLMWSKALRATDGKSMLALGVEVDHEHVTKRRFIGLVDSTNALKFEVKRSEVDDLMKIAFAAATESGLTPPTPADPTISATVTTATGDTTEIPVSIVRQPHLEPQGQQARAVVEFIVDTTGHVEPESFVAVIATDKDIEKEARRVILNSEFRPARYHGQPVRQLVTQLLRVNYY